MKNVIFCADDYGQNEVISQAIIDLLRKKRLSATSCLVTTSHWLSHAENLKPLSSQADIGLHFNLTEGQSLTGQTQFMPVSQLLLRAYLHLLPAAQIEAELNAQLDRFIEGIGQIPAFIDGHQHIHQFPVIREVLLKVYEERLRAHGVYIRCVHDPRIFKHFRDNGFIKRLIIEMSGARTFKKILFKENIPHNQSFAGIYDFKYATQYAAIYPTFLKQVEENGLIMCHPGLEGHPQQDEIALARYEEYQYLLSDKFMEANAVYGIVVGRGNKSL